MLVSRDVPECHKSFDVQKETRQLVLNAKRLLLCHLVHDRMTEFGECRLHSPK